MQNPDILFFFDRMPAALPLYESFESHLRKAVGEYTTRVQKTQITFSNRHVFACVSFLKVRKAAQRPPVYIVITFGLARKLDSPRIAAAVEAYPGRWTHHVLISRREEIDEELMAWVKEAHAFSASK